MCGEIVGYLCKVNRRVWAYVCNYGGIIGHGLNLYVVWTNSEGMFSHVLVYGGITLLVSTGED